MGFLITRTIFISAIFFVACGSADISAGRGPLLFAVHYTCPVQGIDAAAAESLLAGVSEPVAKQIGAQLNIYVDKRIAGSLAAEYPKLSFTPCGQPPAEDKRALFICDINSIAPSMKLLTVGGCFPWGRLQRDYFIDKDTEYPIMKQYAGRFNAGVHITVVQTGVTAMSRAFMSTVNAHGDLKRPIAGVRQITANADVSLTSNEVSFTDNCKSPLPNRMLFCSPKRYFSILQDAGFNVIELTGNHNNDYGAAYNKTTIDLYEKNNIKFFGGGRNKKEAEAVLYINVKGIRFAFVGFNQWGPSSAWATDSRAGAAKLSAAAYNKAVSEAAANAEVVFVSVQWGNEDNPVPHKEQTQFFRRAADMGACIMVSSSAHRAMGVEFYKGKFISYGLGNLFFDQMQTINHRRGMIARHHFYGSRHIQTELIPYLIYNYSEPKIVYGRDAGQLFDYVFKYSLGGVFGK